LRERKESRDGRSGWGWRQIDIFAGREDAFYYSNCTLLPLDRPGYQHEGWGGQGQIKKKERKKEKKIHPLVWSGNMHG
jgi:hypothetical protein